MSTSSLSFQRHLVQLCSHVSVGHNSPQEAVLQYLMVMCGGEGAAFCLELTA